MIDTNSIIRTYLASGVGATATLVALVGQRIYCPRLPENATLPAVSFFTRGGVLNPHIADLLVPSVQFDCWAKDVEVAGVVTVKGSVLARQVYRALYDALQGIQQVTVGANRILSAREEVHGQDLVDVEIPNYFHVLTFFEIILS